MMTLIIISLIIFLAYVAGTCLYFGVPASISDTYYKLERRRKGLGWLFTAMCWGVGGLLLPAWLDMTPDNIQFLPFLSCAGLLFVGAAPQFKLSLTGAVHYGSAAVCVLASQIWIACTAVWWILLPVWIGFVCYILYGIIRYSDLFRGNIYFIQSKPMFWAEIAALGATYVAILLLNCV